VLQLKTYWRGTEPEQIADKSEFPEAVASMGVPTRVFPEIIWTVRCANRRGYHRAVGIGELELTGTVLPSLNKPVPSLGIGGKKPMKL